METFERRLDLALCGSFGRPLRHESSTGSTNRDALAWAAGGAPEGAVVVADQQTEGRGRRGRSWLSEPGTSLLFSLVLRPQIGTEGLDLLTTAVGVACAEAVREVSGADALIKWPNDVTIEGRKVSGILVESEVRGSRLRHAVAGIGVNLDWSGRRLPAAIRERATDLASHMTEPPDRAVVLAAILSWFEPLYLDLGSAGGRDEVLALARARSAILGQRVSVTGPWGESEGKALGLADDGSLEVDLGNRRVRLKAGEVERLRTSEPDLSGD